MSLYLKYRPQRIAELDLGDVREILDRMVKGGKIPQAILLAGPRGTGKTSVARILAKVLNCEENVEEMKEPCNKCDQCISIASGSNIDVVEIDAASHRGIDDVRSIIESAKLSPARARNKVYIIDEAHMLTLEASNALLKTLEEPPRKTFFFLATTEPEKLIPTIRSRTTIINFKKASIKEIVLSLDKKAKAEGKKVDKRILNLIASRSDGSFRDAVKILEEVFNENVELSFEKVSEYLDKSAFFDASLFIEKLLNKDLSFVLGEIRKMSEAGVSSENLVDKMIDFVRDEILALEGFGEVKLGVDQERLLSLAEELLDVKRGLKDIVGFEFLPLEIFVIRFCGERSGSEEEDSSNEVTVQEKDKPTETKEKPKGRLSSKKNSMVDESLSDDKWREILGKVGLVDISVGALLRAAKPLRLNNGLLEVGVYYSFHKSKLEEFRHRQILEKACSTVFGQDIKVVCSLIKPPDIKKIDSHVVLSESQDEDIVEVAKKIFGS